MNSKFSSFLSFGRLELIVLWCRPSIVARLSTTFHTTALLFALCSYIVLPGAQDLVRHGAVLVNQDAGGDAGDPGLRSQLQEGTDEQRSGSHGNAGAPLASGQGHGSGGRWEALAHRDLRCESACNDKEEVGVVEEGLKDVEVTPANFPAVDFVEELQEHEGVEDVSEVPLLGKGGEVGGSVSSFLRTIR